MKRNYKILLILMLVCIMLLLISCSNVNSNKTNQINNSTEAEQSISSETAQKNINDNISKIKTLEKK